MLRKIALLLMGLMWIHLVSLADIYEGYVVNGLKFTANGGVGTCSVSAEYSSWDPKHVPIVGELDIPATITVNGYIYTVTEIGIQGFLGEKQLTKVNLPNTIKRIEGMAFHDCGLTELEIPESVKEIGANAFDGSNHLARLVIPSSVDKLGMECFRCRIGEVVMLPNPDVKMEMDVFGADPYENVGRGIYPSTYVRNPFIGSFPDGGSVCCITYSPDDYKFESGVLTNAAGTNLLFVSSVHKGVYRIPDSVTNIGAYAFKGCSGITEVVMPEAISSIESQTFYECTSLSKINLPSALTNIGWRAFYNCDLKTLVIPPAVENIGGSAFAGNANMESIELAESETPLKIGKYVFSGCPKVTTMKINRNWEYYEDYEHAGISECIVPENVEHLSIGPKVTVLPDYAFYNCTKLESLTIPSTVLTVGKQLIGSRATKFSKFIFAPSESALTLTGNSSSSVFSGSCDLQIGRNLIMEAGCFPGVENLTINGNVTAIPENAFENCKALAKVDIQSSGLTEIGAHAFENCKALAKVDIQSSGLTEIGAHAFDDCEALTSIKFPDTLKHIGEYAFAATSLETVELPFGLEVIPAGAFAGCSKLADVSLPSSVSIIGDSAFSWCHMLKEFTIPAHIKSLGKYVFGSLEKCTIEDSTEPIELSVPISYETIKNCYLGRNLRIVDEDGDYSMFINSLEVGNLVTEIQESLFRRANLKNLRLGSGLTEIGKEAFSRNALETLIIPANVKSIGNRAFAECGIKRLILGSGLETIADEAFTGNNAINSVDITAINPPVASNSTFSFYYCPLSVMPESMDAYKASRPCWYLFGNAGGVESLVAPVKVELKEKEVSLAQNEEYRIQATIFPENTSLKDLYYKSTNPAVATVDLNGVVRLVKSGNVRKESMAIDAETAAAPCEIQVFTLYSKEPVATCRINASGSGVDGIMEEEALAQGSSMDIYTLQGVCIKHNAIATDIEALSPGFYIIGGKKIVKK